MQTPTRTQEVAVYIRDVTAELASIAESGDMTFLTYLLRLAEAEAEGLTEVESPKSAPDQDC